MRMRKLWTRCAAFLLVLVVIFGNIAINPETLQAATKKQVKTISLRIGSKKVAKKTVTMYSGESKKLKITVSPKNAKKKVAFKSSKKSVASVNNKGVITAKKSGTAQIKVTVTDKNGKKKTSFVKVKVKYVSLSLDKKTASIKVGQSLALKAKVSPKKSVKWKSSNRKVVSVSSKGSIKGLKEGTAKVTAYVGNKSVSCTVKVAGSAGNGDDSNNSAEVGVKEVYASLEGGDTVFVGHSKPIVTKIVPENATNKTLSYYSSNSAVAQVNNRGLILGISPGTATITVQASGNVSTEVNVKVVEVPVESVSIKPDEVKLTITGVVNLTAEIMPAEASNKLVNWSSDNMEIASVDANGKVTGRSEGTTEIKAQVAGSDRFGVCKVTVDDPAIADGISMKVTNPYEDNAGNIYPNTVLFGRDMSLRVRLMKDNQPAGGTNVNLSMKSVYGNAEDCFEIRQTNERTDGDGYANFYIGVKDPDLNAVCGKWQSFLVTARDSSSNKTAELAVRFATVQMDQIEVLSDIVPSRNASYADSGLYETVSTNGSKKIEYVTSQQVSSADKDHRVRMDAQPYLLLPATRETANSGEWYVTFPNKDNTGVSGNYSIYNDDTNETTTTTVEEIPAGLNYLSVSFDKLSLSKYTALYMDLYNAETGDLMEHQERTAENNGLASVVSLGKQVDERSYLVISLVSQGQVEADAEGYSIREITGEWTSVSNEKATIVELEDAVKWELVSPKFSEPKELQNVREYVPDGMVTDSYVYKYRVPAFPWVGNAIIEATGPNNDGVKEYFAYPSVNMRAGNSYANDNTLAPVRRASKAVYLGEDDVTRQVGKLSQEGNIAIVESMETGITVVKAMITVNGLEPDELNSQNGETLYSSIQWVPVPNSEVLEVVPDYYALEGQTVTITAQIIDANGQDVAGQRIVTFQHNGGTISYGDQISNSGTNTTDYVTVSESTDGTTDKNGKITLKLKGINAGYIEGITATCADNFNVKLTIGSNTQEEIRKANIYWVDLGLTYVNSAVEADEPVRTTNFSNVVKTIAEESSSMVGKRWKIGFLPVAQSHKFAYSNPEAVDRPMNSGEFISVSNIPIAYSQEGVGECDANSSTPVLYSERIGATYLNGRIALPSDTSNVVFSFYDEDGNEVSHKNIGDNGSSNTTDDTGLKYQMNWGPSGKHLKVETEQTSLRQEQDTEVYVRVVDDYGNSISNVEIEYVVNGCHGSIGTQTGITDENGTVTISLPAPYMSGATDISVIGEKDNDLRGSITITYN